VKGVSEGRCKDNGDAAGLRFTSQNLRGGLGVTSHAEAEKVLLGSPSRTRPRKKVPTVEDGRQERLAELRGLPGDARSPGTADNTGGS
jgi:hypothetical protein